MSAFMSFHGNLTQDPTLNKYGNQDCLRLSVANRTTRKMEDGTYLTNFYDVTVWGQRATWLADRICKGTLVYVTGEFQAVPYVSKKDNQQRISLQIANANVDPLARAKGDDAAKTARSQKSAPPSAPVADDEEDGDIPF